MLQSAQTLRWGYRLSLNNRSIAASQYQTSGLPGNLAFSQETRRQATSICPPTIRTNCRCSSTNRGLDEPLDGRGCEVRCGGAVECPGSPAAVQDTQIDSNIKTQARGTPVTK
ncbi:hypothetical protein IQ268_30560 [Oculatella sp. LEGE 06141]|uniref:hypothetical protein n=1 Tax=Oculatella sp. LEGE 06141 TaxID=1828648 RepID=UPI00187E04E0|nr:hypothetical protein [Oculatella sp. LEGE 06141]MBE9182881.1 hypothetical protein [Oculatella sp. LEGE 06141]